MNRLISMILGALALLATGIAWAQTGHMMDDGGHGMGWFGGYGFWGAVLLGALVVAVVFLLMDRRKK
ncbi:hypothetical protein [Thioalkalivibrio sp. XN279]|uniref:hypothetical protein n=1 Tax=Thioalkalivibrio sp. XN279 TaxID=2714953 RepID=UPI0014096BB8|nr:hypothetical protein [Thioalkalivibrio sp. XN279]NHA14170.1 hypothetical protein [Thioalkalivibrio sp. XN279]